MESNMTETQEEYQVGPALDDQAEQEILDAVEAEGFFAADLDDVTVPWPKCDGCWVTLRPMDGPAVAEYESMGRSYQFDTDGKASVSSRVSGQIDQRKQEEYLVCATVVDFLTKRKSKAVTGEGEVWVEVRAGAAQEKLRRQFIREQLCGDRGRGIPGLAPGHWRWLVYQCTKINGLLPRQGN